MTRWVLHATSSQDDLHRVVADLRPPARAHGARSAPLALTSPLVDLFPFVPPQFVTERLGRLPVVFRELLPPGSTWLHALDEPDDRWRVQIVGLAEGMVPARTPLAGFVPAGGVVVDPARGDRVDLVVRGLPTFLAL